MNTSANPSELFSRSLPNTTHRASPAVVITQMAIDAPPEAVWPHLTFYEQIAERPPMLLRSLLPTPVRAIGAKAQVGDRVTCEYTTGTLIKQVTLVDPPRRLEFDVCEQKLSLCGIRLIGGSYTLRELRGGVTEVELATHYLGGMRPRRLWLPIEALLCHAVHRHILRSLRSNVMKAADPH